MKWSREEDYIVCGFYLSHLDEALKVKYLDELMSLLQKAGYGSRSRRSVKMRIHNYRYLHTGMGLSNYARQSQEVYATFAKRTVNARVYQGLKAYVKENYSKSESDVYDESFSLGAQDASNFIYTEPLGPTFQDVLFGFIDQRGMKDSEVYNACLVGRDTFSHIRKGDKGVSKRTVKQLCFGLKLTYDEAVVLMASAGYAFSSSNLSDVIVAYYLKNCIYDIDDANITLYENNAEMLFTA